MTPDFVHEAKAYLVAVLALSVGVIAFGGAVGATFGPIVRWARRRFRR